MIKCKLLSIINMKALLEIAFTPYTVLEPSPVSRV